MVNNILVKKSKIHQKGVFAKRKFRKGEVVLRWNPRALKQHEIKKLSSEERNYLYKDDSGKYLLMQPPEKYVNHSCEANTEVKNQCDVAIKGIKEGEEITSDYGKGGNFVSFFCKCGGEKCRGIIG